MSDLFGYFAGAMIGFVLIVGLLGIAVYVVYALGLYKTLERFGYDKPWMAWIPFAQDYAISKLTRDIEGNTTILKTTKIKNDYFVWWFAVSFIVGFIPTIGWILSTAIRIVCLGTCFKVVYSRMENKTEDEVAVIAYLSGFIKLIGGIKMLMYK